MTTHEIHNGDCRATMRFLLDDNSVDSIVTDPPYGIDFMGKGWDKGVPGLEFWEAALAVAKPGAYLAAFGGTRTFHRQVCAIEDAGWEIQDCLMWMYGTGFPKHKSKLKPAWEPITLARKPAKKATPLNIDTCRIGSDVLPAQVAGQARLGTFERGPMLTPEREGRWPANVVLDEEAAAVLDEQTGTLTSGKADVLRRNTDKFRNTYAAFAGVEVEGATYGDSGGASRFFYCAKASRSEREAGLDALPTKQGGIRSETSGQHISRRDGGDPKEVHNHHPTVKPVALMRWLTRLITPSGGLVLDPFAGSGSTGVAALAEGFSFIGCELSDEYAAIARARLAHV